MTAQQMIEKAALLIESRGWCQGDYEDDRGRICMQGALNRAASECDTWSTHYDACDLVEKFLNQSPERFNDAKGRTKEEVIAALRAAARQA